MALMVISMPSANARDRTKPLTETTIIVGSELDYPPYALIDKDGNADGFSVDLIKAVAKEMNLKLKFVTGPWSEVKGKLERGEIDALPLVAYSNERDTYFDFTQPHIISHAVIFFRKESSFFRSPEEIRGKEIIVMRGDSTEEFVTNNQLSDKLIYTNTMEEGFKLLASGKHDALIAPELVGHLIINKLNLTSIKHLLTPLDTYGKGYAFAVQQGDKALLDYLERGLILVKQGDEYDKIYNKWFSQSIRKDIQYEKFIDKLIITSLLVVLLVILGIIWNTTLRRQVREQTSALRESEERFRTLVNNAGDAFFLIDSEGNFVDVNDMACAALGYSREELLTMHIPDIQLDVPLDHLKRLWGKIETGTSTTVEGTHKCKDGSTHPVEVRITKISHRDDFQIIAVARDITKRKLAEQLIRDNEAAFRAITETLPMAIYVSSDIEQHCKYMNKTFTELFGYTIEDVPSVAEWWPKAYPDEVYSNQVAQEWREKIARAIKTGSSIEPMETVVTCKDGSTKEIQWGFSSLGNLDYSFGLDITERNRALRKIKEDEKKFRALFESTPDYALIMEVVDEGPPVIIDANKSAFKHFQYSRDEMVGQRISNFETETSKREVQHRVDITKGGIVHFEVTHLRKDGSTFIASVSAQRMDHQDRTLYCTVERDISEQKMALEKIEKLSQAVMQSGEAVVIANAKGEIEYVNPAFTAITGYSEEEALGKNPSILKSGNQSSRFYKEMWKTLNKGNTWQGKVVNRKKDMSFYPAMLTISPIKNERDEITHYIGLQQSLESYEELEAQFRQAQKMEAIGTLVGGIAHDFNNILAGITGNLYLLKKEVDQMPKSASKVATIEKLSRHAAELIRQLLTFARKGIVDMKSIPLTSFIKELIKLIRSSTPENIAISYDITNEPMLVKGDSTQLHQVLLNLVTNAVHAVEDTEQPTIKIELNQIEVDKKFIRKHPDVKLGSYAHIAVIDNGYGIPESQMEHLFEPFFTTKAQGKGTGLGLAMVFGAVQSHSGFIDVESEIGLGSTFHVYLPIHAEAIEKPISDPLEAFLPGNGETILVVDDEINVLNSTVEVLESLHYKVITASNGLEAIKTYEQHKDEISLVIMDVIMPKMGGVPAYEKIKEIDNNAKVIFLTGYDRGEVVSNSGLAKNTPTLSKPYSVKDLAKVIRTMLAS